METFAIRHTFPNGDTLGDGYIHSGDVHPQPIAWFDVDDAEATVHAMRAHNPGHTFEVVPYPIYRGIEAPIMSAPYHARFAEALTAALPEGFTVTADRHIVTAEYGTALLIRSTPAGGDQRQAVTGRQGDPMD